MKAIKNQPLGQQENTESDFAFCVSKLSGPWGNIQHRKEDPVKVHVLSFVCFLTGT